MPTRALRRRDRYGPEPARLYVTDRPHRDIDAAAEQLARVVREELLFLLGHQAVDRGRTLGGWWCELLPGCGGRLCR